MKAMFGDCASRDDRRLAGLKKARANQLRPTTHVLLHGIEHKSCAGCASLKPLDNYSHDKHHVDGLRSYCRACESNRRKREAA